MYFRSYSHNTVIPSFDFKMYSFLWGGIVLQLIRFLYCFRLLLSSFVSIYYSGLKGFHIHYIEETIQIRVIRAR